MSKKAPYYKVIVDSGYCRVVYKVKLNNKFKYFCDQWEVPNTSAPEDATFYACTDEFEPIGEVKRPDWLPLRNIDGVIYE